jgi:hypothetical protein
MAEREIAVKTSTPEVITEKVVRDRMLRHFPPHASLIAVNLCGIGPYTHEMDMVRVLDSGWAHEFEIKISAADIRADAKKLAKYADWQKGCEKKLYPASFGEHEWSDEQLMEKAKHLPVAGQIGSLYVSRVPWPTVYARIERPIKYFTCIVPTDALAEIAITQLPEWVGVSVCERWSLHEKRKAKQLPHSRKLTDEERRHILHRMYNRFWEMYFNVDEDHAGRLHFRRREYGRLGNHRQKDKGPTCQVSVRDNRNYDNPKSAGATTWKTFGSHKTRNIASYGDWLRRPAKWRQADLGRWNHMRHLSRRKRGYWGKWPIAISSS